MALLSEPNMRIPILYALFIQKGLSKNIKKDTLTKLVNFHSEIEIKKVKFFNFGIEVISNSN